MSLPLYVPLLVCQYVLIERCSGFEKSVLSILDVPLYPPIPKCFLIKTALKPLFPVTSVIVSSCCSVQFCVPGVVCSPNTGAVPCIPKFLISFLFAVVGSHAIQLLYASVAAVPFTFTEVSL